MRYLRIFHIRDQHGCLVGIDVYYSNTTILKIST